VSNWAAMPNVFVVHPSVPVRSMRELVKLLQASPKKFNFATPGIGTTPDLSAALLRITLRLDASNVPYNGAGPAVAATVANQVPLGCMALPATQPHIQAGRLRALAVTSPRRSQVLPEVPTLSEAGYAGQEAETIQALLVPAGTPQVVIARLYTESAKALSSPPVKERIAAMGFEILASSPSQLAEQVRAEVAKWRKVVQEAGIRVE
jgi:tripartite-type tricarboxylate transporter receptor subunit TctC